MSAEYEIRPHHAFKGWKLIYRQGRCIRAVQSQAEAEDFVRRHKSLEDLKGRMVQL